MTDRAQRRTAVRACLGAGLEHVDIDRASVGDIVHWRRVQDSFLARSRQAIDDARRNGSGISPEQLLRGIDVRLDEAREIMTRRR